MPLQYPKLTKNIHNSPNAPPSQRNMRFMLHMLHCPAEHPPDEHLGVSEVKSHHAFPLFAAQRMVAL